MDKGERISHFVSGLAGEGASVASDVPVEQHPYYRAFFQCWNEQRYYEAHDVLEQVWLKKKSEDENFFKGLIQAAGAFVHLQKNFNEPPHPKHAGRLPPGGAFVGRRRNISRLLRRIITGSMCRGCSSCFAEPECEWSNPIIRPIHGRPRQRPNWSCGAMTTESAASATQRLDQRREKR